MGALATKAMFMNLKTRLDGLPNGLDDGLCILAVKPWSATSLAEAVQLDEEFKPPVEAVAKGLVYFLEVHVANETLEVFAERPPTAIEELDLLIIYAENDAFPDWIYAR